MVVRSVSRCSLRRQAGGDRVGREEPIQSRASSRIWDITEDSTDRFRMVPPSRSKRPTRCRAYLSSGAIDVRPPELAVSNDHKRAVILSETTRLLLWDVPGNVVVALLEGHRGQIESRTSAPTGCGS